LLWQVWFMCYHLAFLICSYCLNLYSVFSLCGLLTLIPLLGDLLFTPFNCMYHSKCCSVVSRDMAWRGFPLRFLHFTPQVFILLGDARFLRDACPCRSNQHQLCQSAVKTFFCAFLNVCIFEFLNAFVSKLLNNYFFVYYSVCHLSFLFFKICYWQYKMLQACMISSTCIT